MSQAQGNRLDRFSGMFSKSASGGKGMKNVRLRFGPRCTPTMRLASFATAVWFMLSPLGTFAGGGLPTGGQVVHGNVNIDTVGANMNINQLTGQAIVNWESFNIGAGNAVNVNQPDAMAAMLSRVIGADPSAILGALQANGIFYLINPNGVYFAPGATVDVAQLIASTLNISNQDFLAGKLNFSGDSLAAVVNAGQISADAAALIGKNVTNAGTITAGEVVLAAAKNVEI